ncbi:hypothetical protein S83_051508 [Arachis hypogaea]
MLDRGLSAVLQRPTSPPPSKPLCLYRCIFQSLRSMKHVILTFSIAAVTFNGRLLTPKAVVDDTWFFDHELCKESKSWY